MRGSLGIGSVADSEQQSVLKLSGYERSGFRTHYLLDGGGFPWPHVGIGAFGGYSSRKVSPGSGGPPLEEDVWLAGVELPLTVGNEKFRVLFFPRFGFVTGKQSLHGDGEFVLGPLYGVDIACVFPKVHGGVSFGGYSAPAPASGDLGESENFGGVYLALSLYFDG